MRMSIPSSSQLCKKSSSQIAWTGVQVHCGGGWVLRVETRTQNQAALLHPLQGQTPPVRR